MNRRRLFVSSEADLPGLLEGLDSVELLSFGSPSRPAERPRAIEPDRYHAFAFNDIGEPREDLVAPSRADADRLIATVLASAAPTLVFQCWFGVSRSTAALLIGASALGIDTPVRLTESLRASAPWATPNPMLIAHGDNALELDGALTAAVAGIGRGETTTTGHAFEFCP